MKILGRIDRVALFAIGVIAPNLWVSAAGASEGTTLTVDVTDHRGEPVNDVVIYAQPSGHSESGPAEPTESAVMDQVDTNFLPHILVARTGSEIHFPNNDNVSHHVYSFSDAKNFELPLYKGTAHSPLLFDTPGLVVLGCNIHDNMLGYILLVDTPHFTKSGPQGHAELDGLPAGDYSIHVWTPRLRSRSLPPAKNIVLGGAEEQRIGFQFTEKLAPAHAPEDGALTWSAY